MLTATARAEVSRQLSTRLVAHLSPIALALVAAFLAFERLPANTRRTLWAEDGAVFLYDALRGQCNVLAAYAGYLHVLPRAAALAVVNLVDVRRYAIGINVSACLLTGLVAAVVYIGAEDLIPERPLRLWLALITVLLPLLGMEVLANLANLHTIMMWGAFWALQRHPRTLRGALGLACFELSATLSEVQSVLLVPLAVLALWRQRSLRQALVVGACLLGAGGQMWTSWTHERGSTPHLLALPIVLQLLAVEVVMPLWVVSTARVHELLENYGWWLSVAGAAPILTGALLSLRCGDADQRAASAAALAAGLLIFCASHMLNGAVMGGPEYSVLAEAPVLIRYAVAPSLFFLVPLVVGTAAALQRGERWTRWLGLGAIGMLMFGEISQFRADENVRYPETSWTRQLSEARAACRAGDSAEYHFQISPPPWEVAVPCARLSGWQP